jgi:hypothetical protein
MAHDGALGPNQNVGIKTPSAGKVKSTLWANIWWFNSHRLSVALINWTEFRDSKVSFQSFYFHIAKVILSNL